MALKQQVEEKIGERVVAAGELRQGKKPSMLALLTGIGLIEILRPRRSKALPKRFVLALTEDRAVAVKAMGVSDEDNRNYRVHLRGDVAAAWPREQVRLSDVVAGSEVEGGTLHLGAEQVPVFQPSLSGDAETDELIGLLSG